MLQIYDRFLKFSVDSSIVSSSQMRIEFCRIRQTRCGAVVVLVTEMGTSIDDDVDDNISLS